MKDRTPDTGLIFDIKRFAVHDGPGIRITIFFKGCPLSCPWCHNPESRAREPEKRIQKHRIKDIEFQSEETIGKYYTVDELMSHLRREKVFMDHSEGGVTFSGGEPLLQVGFLEKILKACKEEGMHTAVDTSGFASRSAFERILPYTDLFLYDIKHLDNTKHEQYTGVSNQLILDNLALLVDKGKPVQIRFPVIPGINDDESHIIQWRQFLQKYQGGQIKMLNLLPYHKVNQKYQNLNQDFTLQTLEPPTNNKLEAIKQKLQSNIKIKIGG
jgi:pyruvate formate lyase activating enzyme